MTTADRKRREREAKRAAGLVPKEVWVRPADWPRIRRYIERVAATPPAGPERRRAAVALADLQPEA